MSPNSSSVFGVPGSGFRSKREPCRAANPGGFTLVELLTVMAIIGVLAAILIPTVGSVRTSANKAKTRVQFNQWAAAIESFRSEYGYYPIFDSSNLVNPAGQNTDPTALHLFHDVLSAHRRSGDALPAYVSGASGNQTPEAQNRKLVRFYTFPESDFSSTNLLQDASGNTAIAVLVDRNLDGVIRVGGTNPDYAALPSLSGMTPTSGSTTADFPLNGIRAGIVFYAPAPNAMTDNPQFVFSWK